MGIEGTLYDFLVLIDRQEDPDTLVFQRRLAIEGDTELGLRVKNFLDMESPGRRRAQQAGDGFRLANDIECSASEVHAALVSQPPAGVDVHAIESLDGSRCNGLDVVWCQ